MLKKNRWPYLFIACGVALLFFISSDASQHAARALPLPPEEGLYQVVKVVDGDTLWVKKQEGPIYKVRIAGIDAPESCQQGGQEAKQYLQTLLEPSLIVQWTHQDVYGRWLAHLQQVSSKKNIAEQMVLSGYAWSYQQQGKGLYDAQEAIAKRLYRGLFAQHQPPAISPQRFRRQHGPCLLLSTK